MPAPSVAYTVINDPQIDVDSPITEGLMTQFRNNIENLRQWLGGSFTAAVDHKHDGIDSALLSGNVVGNLFNYYNFGH